jgi:hypothetical protein
MEVNMKNKMCLLTIVFILFGAFFSSDAFSADPYFAFEESFALSCKPENGRYPIITFIPRTMLLYISDRNKYITISERQYLKATTQDGIEVFVDATTVSMEIFKKTIGSHEIIFNYPKELCRSIGCDKDVPEEVWKIHSGDAFKMFKASTHDFYKLEGNRYGQKIIGYINKKELDEMTLCGITTRADKTHPKYTIKREISNELSTCCGETIKKGTIKKLGVGVEIDLSILKAFGLGVKTELGADVQTEISKEYGSANSKFSFFVYHVENNRTGEKYKLIAQVIYECKHGLLAAP